MRDVYVGPRKISGVVTPPPSKSDAHRALIAAALCRSRCQIIGLPEPLSMDLMATRRCLEALLSGKALLDCGESGTTLRLLIPIAGALPSSVRADTVTFTGSGRLPYRPLSEYRDILEPFGLTLQFPPDAFLPLKLSGQLQPGVFGVPGHISSQYLSGLLFALPLLSRPSEIYLTTPLESAPYVAMTIRTLARFGVRVEPVQNGFYVPAPQVYQPTVYTIEKDYSQAAFWLVAAYGGCKVTVTGLPEETAQGDKAIVELLSLFSKRQSETVIDASQIPDLVPILSVAAVLTSTRTRIIRAGRLRLKESDRLKATCDALYRIGADIKETSDGLLIHGAGLSRRNGLIGGDIDSFGDHRIVMSLSIAALFTQKGVIIRGAEAVNKSYPAFFDELIRLGGDVRELDLGTAFNHQLIW